MLAFGQRRGTCITVVEPTVSGVQNYIDNVAILTTNQQTAVTNLYNSLDTDGILPKLFALYPLVWGTATANKWNLVNPLDTDAAFRITWSGTVTHNATGVKSDGTTGYGDTHWIPSNETTINDFAFGVYKTGTEANGTSRGYIGNGYNGTVMGWIADAEIAEMAGSNDKFPAGQLQQEGFLCATRDITNPSYYINGVYQANKYSNGSIATNSTNILRYTGGLPILESELKLIFISRALTETDVANINTAFNTFIAEYQL